MPLQPKDAVPNASDDNPNLGCTFVRSDHDDMIRSVFVFGLEKSAKARYIFRCHCKKICARGSKVCKPSKGLFRLSRYENKR